jgi:hypothetical protein
MNHRDSELIGKTGIVVEHTNSVARLQNLNMNRKIMLDDGGEAFADVSVLERAE